MNLMISKIPLRHRSAAIAAMQADVAVDILSYVIGKSALGRMLVARSVDGVCAILIGADQDELKADLGCRFPQAILVANEAVVHDDLAKVIRFVDKPAEGIHLTLDMRGTPLQRRVWENRVRKARRSMATYCLKPRLDMLKTKLNMTASASLPGGCLTISTRGHSPPTVS